MYLDTAFIKAKGKTYKRTLLRTSFRENGKVKHKTIANLSGQSDEVIQAIKFALQNKQDIQKILINNSSEPIAGYSFAALYVLNEISKRLHINSVLGLSGNAKLALWQIFARIIDQGSRLSAVRLADLHAVCEILNLGSFTEDDLYKNFRWLAANQEKIEIKLFKYKKTEKTSLFLYDVTGSYTEGEHNEFCDYGYNRDKKKGKKQIVIGLLTDFEGDPVSVQVFTGNTTDSSTFIEQVHKVSEKFKVINVIMVGDRGMIKKPQIDSLPESFYFITAITKPQILALIKNKKIKFEDFSEKIKEIKDADVRYILKRNPIRAKETEESRESKFFALEKEVQIKNIYLKDHPKATIENAIIKIKAKAKKLKIDSWINVIGNERKIECTKDQERLKSESILDGCYVLKTNSISSSENTSEIIHERYKDLKYVENAFRTMKTTHLEIRPYYVRKKVSTEGHVFIVMLAYKIIRYLKMEWSSIDTTVEEGINILASIRGLTNEEKKYQTSPKLDKTSQELIQKLNIELPKILPIRTCVVATRKKPVRGS